ncbi:MAG: squalene--hopene cyclase [Gammaproteobacteria bacterium]|nr:squalene--hopene cyclase [Gammaproteobacteria bacterium]NIN61496.1 squalene--hopene cyclase [Gammaproteobacteria bacterium]NIO61263.1 squalene--hopene cyclase [Gammaproteobacteria bacterium]NIP48803.1 squalene--hopene cyclase [Gammaproteobacteria bacterium]NIQ09257.1 squalene--hopene cyclase [Gammaproteobacteria bacterium]
MLQQPKYLVTSTQASTSEKVRRLMPLSLAEAIQEAKDELYRHQHADGHWIYELEADCTIPAEYILMNHFTGEIDDSLEKRIANYLRDQQNEDGGWSLYTDGAFDISCSVKTYYALKLVGDDPNVDHMVRARNAILAHGGAAHSNVFTRIALALFGQVPWRAVPFIPAEVILLPAWFPFHISKVSYWSRTVMVPLFILCTLKPTAVNPRGIDIREIFTIPPEDEQNYFRITTFLSRAFLWLDRAGRTIERLVPRFIRNFSIRKCEQWFLKRMNEEHGIGGIFPAMVNVYESLVILGYPKNHPARLQARKAIDNLLVERGDSVYCQPCVSPVWDTCLASQALIEAEEETSPELIKALDWLAERQLTDEPGDWRYYRPNLRGGGWAFQYSNYHYPDLDDTSMVGWAMHRTGKGAYTGAIQRAADWIAGMQSNNGGFGSFEVNNIQYYLNSIPFADHGALLDPPTADVTGRCIALLSLADKDKYQLQLDAAIKYIKRDQEEDGSWYGRWGTNYIYGTWSVLTGLELAGVDPSEDFIRHAVEWLKSVQNQDGGWGESNDSYYPPKHWRLFPSTPFQTAWALLALLAAGEVHSGAVARGIDYLLIQQRVHGLWDDRNYTAPGFPRVFYLKYHGYSKYFPLWALARYQNRLQQNHQ